MGIYILINSKISEIKSVFNYIKNFKQPLKIIRHIILNEFPFDAFVRGQQKAIHIENRLIAWWVSNGLYDFAWNIMDNELSFKANGKILKLVLKGNHGDINGIFLKEKYRNLQTRGSVIFDIGCNIGDSLLYFVNSGAIKVIGIEPIKELYDLSLYNMSINNIKERVIVLNAFLSDSKSSISLPQSVTSGPGSQLEWLSNTSNQDKISVESITLDELFKLSPNEADKILKLNCNGCEYDIIKKENIPALSMFMQIHITYSYGYKKLVEILNLAGFQCKIFGKKNIINPFTSTEKKEMEFGELFAWR